MSRKKKDDSAFIASFRKSNLNVMHLTADILDCDLIEDSKKLLALDDLHRMSVSKKYAKDIAFNRKHEFQYDVNYTPICQNHLWHRSELGWEFWYKINEIIYPSIQADDFKVQNLIWNTVKP